MRRQRSGESSRSRRSSQSGSAGYMGAQTITGLTDRKVSRLFILPVCEFASLPIYEMEIPASGARYHLIYLRIGIFSQPHLHGEARPGALI